MSGPTLEIKASGRTRTIPLQAGLTRIAGPETRGVDVVIDGATGELHLSNMHNYTFKYSGESKMGRGCTIKVQRLWAALQG